jgi:hypothetical protein
MLRNTINTVIILTLLIYEIKIEKYTKLFTRAIKNLHCIKQLQKECSCLARTSLVWFQAVPKASGRWQNTPEVGYICPLSREARKSEMGHICPTGHERVNFTSTPLSLTHFNSIWIILKFSILFTTPYIFFWEEHFVMFL